MRELVVGEGDAMITFVLAKQFGFCWGVERSIELAWAARDAYPEKTMHPSRARHPPLPPAPRVPPTPIPAAPLSPSWAALGGSGWL